MKNSVISLLEGMITETISIQTKDNNKIDVKEFTLKLLRDLQGQYDEDKKIYNYLNSKGGKRRIAAKTFSWLRKGNIVQTKTDVQTIWSYKGLLVLNPFLGCNYGCVYCFREDVTNGNSDWFLKGQPVRVAEDEELFKSLLQHELFIKDETIIALHSATTEPFLPSVKSSTFKLIELIHKNKLKNPILIITKYYLTEEDVSRLAYYAKDLNILLFLTYNANPPEIEPLGNKPKFKELRWKTRDILARYPEVKWLHYYRPIIEGWNDSVEQIKESLEYGAPSGISVIGGMKLIPDLHSYLKERNAPLPKGTYKENTKAMPEDLTKKIMKVHRDNNFSSIIVSDQACGISLLIGKYLGEEISNIEAIKKFDNIRDYKVCMKLCSDKQINLCSNPLKPNRKQVLFYMKEFDFPNNEFDINDNGVIIKSTSKISSEKIFALIVQLKYPVQQKISKKHSS
ncbi:hypothetical protein COJ27_29855 [Bacillus cereus]|uniref:hypothetical protein n=1 Tax=Bacillus cereus TaxID=1396 RepID=UPI000BF3F5D9|nr:hypothetical protein [Bacillus cereus]PFL57208.1 hypothetical protein COJ27_29855 [Bacillus cereus]